MRAMRGLAVLIHSEDVTKPIPPPSFYLLADGINFCSVGITHYKMSIRALSVHVAPCSNKTRRIFIELQEQTDSVFSNCFSEFLPFIKRA